MRSLRSLSAIACGLVLALAACGSPVTVGGTEGTLTTGPNPLGDFEVRIYDAADLSQPVGQGVTGYDGRFELVTPDGSRAVDLPAGAYRVTVESVGSPVVVPDGYRDAAATPLAFDHDGSGPIALGIPGLTLPKD